MSYKIEKTNLLLLGAILIENILLLNKFSKTTYLYT